ncbi:MAG: phosphoglycolate phosphatase [Burkholderiaceae bacterium]
MKSSHPLLTPDGELAGRPRAVLFDLDGTLADTAADLSAPANALRALRGLPPLPVDDLRRFASAGVRGLLGRALDLRPGDAGYEELRVAFLEHYERALCVHTRVFEGLEAVVLALEASGITWGVVSNKVERYVKPILESLGLGMRCACAVGGDTAEHPKPHPAPLLHAAALIGVDPVSCVYVGDDLRDIQAGRAAGMVTVAAAYGYCGVEDPPERWGADLLVRRPSELGAWLARAA